MAANSGGRKTAASPKTSAKKNTPAQTKRAAEALERNRKRRNISSVVLFALGLLLILLSFIGDISAEKPNFWDIAHGGMLGLFGISAYAVGFVFIYAAIMISKDKQKSTITAKIVQLVLMILLISGMMQIIVVGRIASEGTTEFSAIVAEIFEQGKLLKSGGVVSLAFAAPLLLFGQVGGSIIIILIAFVMIMLIANISVLDLARPFKKIHEYSKEKREQYREDSEYAEEERGRRALLEPEDFPEENSERKASILRTMKSNKKTPDIYIDVVKPERTELDDIKDMKHTNEKFASIAATATVAHIGVTEQDTAQAQELENPVVQQKAEAKDYQGKLNEYVYGKGAAEEPKPTPSEPVPAENEQAPIEDALNAYKEEIAAKNQRFNEKGEKILGTMIETAPDGQQRFADIINTAEQYKLPPIELLNDVIPTEKSSDIDAELKANSKTLVDALKSFGVQTKIVGVCRGPSVTRYEIQPAPGVKISRITGLSDDIAMNLAASGIRIEAPIPGKAAVGVEIPNKQVDVVPIRELIDSETFRSQKSHLAAVLGKDISGEIIMADISTMPHILIAGTTGSGKSVCINSIIMSILYRSTPDDVRLLMIDPKAVEFMIYNGIPHLLIPVVTDPKKASGALSWAVSEMLNRYKMFSDNNVRDLKGYNELAKKDTNDLLPIPQIVIFIDELADLMMVCAGEVEDSIRRLSQMARAAGMHLVIATQRPSVNVVTGVIKANIPSRISLKVASQVDSRTIIDSAGAEKLLGRGDMLFAPIGLAKPIRVQGCWVSEKEVERVSDFIKNSFILDYDQSVIEEIEKQAEKQNEKENKNIASGGDIEVADEKLEEAIQAVIESGQASTSYLQRRLKLGYGRAARLIDIMEEQGIVGTFEGGKPRKVLMSKQEWYERQMRTDE